MTDNLPPRMYGIWIPGKGWWKLPDQNKTLRAYAEVRLEVAERYARWVGHGARVEPIDKSLEFGNDDLVAIEREKADNRWSRKAWRILKNFLRNRNTPNQSGQT